MPHNQNQTPNDPAQTKAQAQEAYPSKMPLASKNDAEFSADEAEAAEAAQLKPELYGENKPQ